MPDKVFESKLTTTFYDPNEKILLAHQKGIMNKELAVEYFNFVLEFTQQHEVKGIIGDLRSFRGSFMRFMSFIENDAYPKLIERGIIAHTFVVSDDLITSNLAEKLKQVLKNLNVASEIFLTPEEAQAWLINTINTSFN